MDNSADIGCRFRCIRIMEYLIYAICITYIGASAYGFMMNRDPCFIVVCIITLAYLIVMYLCSGFRNKYRFPFVYTVCAALIIASEYAMCSNVLYGRYMPFLALFVLDFAAFIMECWNPEYFVRQRRRENGHQD